MYVGMIRLEQLAVNDRLLSENARIMQLSQMGSQQKLFCGSVLISILCASAFSAVSLVIPISSPQRRRERREYFNLRHHLFCRQVLAKGYLAIRYAIETLLPPFLME